MAVNLSNLGINCHDCNDGQKQYRGCNGNSKLNYKYGDVNLDICPVKLLRAETMSYIQFYNWYKKGFLPFSGSVLQQPCKIMKIFDILENAEIEVQQDKEETMRKMRNAR